MFLAEYFDHQIEVFVHYRDAFVEGVRTAIAGGRLSADQVGAARSFTWDRVATRLLALLGVMLS